jgi:protein-tyrosine-phosphatase
MQLLLICAGNIMRSVIAECVVRARADELLGVAAGAISAESCGLKAEEDTPPHPEALRTLEKLGITACDTNSVLVDAEHMERADLAMTMTRQQCYVLAGTFPDFGGKCFSLVEANGAIEMLLEARGVSLDGTDWGSLARAMGPEQLDSALDCAVQEIRSIPREDVRQIPGVAMDVRELMTLFAPCFYQASGIHDPLGGTEEESDRCARLVDREVTMLMKGLLALATT